MKKVLFATTALVATASVAAAEVTVGGSGRFGLAYLETESGDNTPDTRVEQRLRVTFTGIAETDGGVKLEGRIRIESNENAFNEIAGAGPGAAGFAASYGGFRLDVGNVSDVIDGGAVVNYYGYGVGLTSFIEQSSNGALPLAGFGASDQGFTTITATYSAGDLTVAASYSKIEEQDASISTVGTVGGVGSSAGDSVTSTTAAIEEADQYQIGIGYSFGDYNVGAAYGSNDLDSSDDNDFWAISFDGSLGAFGFALLATDSDAQDDATYGGSINYDVSSATSIRFAVSDGGNLDDTAVGIGFRHSLGGGVTLAGGIGENGNGLTVGDLGVSFSF